jgi:Tfp pilus assembly protein PilO
MEESECAKNAVDQAFSSYVEILEDLRRASEAQLQMYNGARSQNAVNLKALRQELDTIQQNR